MKRYFAVLILMITPISAFAGFGNVWRSSHTASADSTKSLCSDVGTGKRKGILHSVCVGDGGNGGAITVYNAYSTAVNPVAVITSTAAAGNCMNFDINMSSGIVYTTAVAGKVTFVYDCY